MVCLTDIKDTSTLLLADTCDIKVYEGMALVFTHLKFKAFISFNVFFHLSFNMHIFSTFNISVGNHRRFFTREIFNCLLIKNTNNLVFRTLYFGAGLIGFEPINVRIKNECFNQI